MAVGKRCAASTWKFVVVRSLPSSARTLSPGADPLSSTSVTTSLITSCHRRFLVISGSSATRWNVATVANSLAVRPSGGARTWTVVGEGYQTVIPVEDWLEAHRYLWSPNTVRGYATSLAHWWTFLEQRREAERWNEVGVPAVSGFLSWLRNGRTVEHALGPAEGMLDRAAVAQPRQ